MKGIVRPSRNRLGQDLYLRWQGHLCGLCLTLGETAGQAARVLTGYDVLLLGVLVEAQAGPQPMVDAGPCPLRGFRPAVVTAPSSAAARMATAGALLTGAAGLSDKLLDGDLPAGSRHMAQSAATRMQRRGTSIAAELELGTDSVLQAPDRAAAAEAERVPELDTLLRPTGDAVSALFAHTAVVAGRPENESKLAEAGEAFGRLVHLLDAVADVYDDSRRGQFNPLLATRTHADDAARLAVDLHSRLVAALAAATMVDRSLVEALLDREVARAVRRALPDAQIGDAGAAICTGAGTCEHHARSRTGSTAASALTGVAALAALTTVAVFGGGGSWQSRPRRRRGYPPPGYEYGYPPPRRGYSRGPSCCDLLACNCCANLACNSCCCCCSSDAF